MKVKLLKDLPGVPAGVIEHMWKNLDGECFCSFSPSNAPQLVFSLATMKTFPDFFEIIEERWKPKGFDIYFYVTDWMTVIQTNYTTQGDDFRIKIGNCFPSQKQACEAATRMKQVLLDYHKEIGE
jgi:hypothetical protein